MSLNGRLTDAELVTVDGVPLSEPTANAYLRMKAAFRKATGLDFWIAKPIGGYRSYFVQADMKIHPELYGLNPASTVSIASAGYSTHGFGSRVDIGSFGSAFGTDGAKRADWLINHASEFGFHREFGDKDPNHFAHDGYTAVGPIIDAADTGGLIPIKKGIFMALTDDEQKELLGKTRDLWGAIGAGQGAGTAAESSVLANARNANANAAAAAAAVKAIPAPPSAAAISKAVWWDQTVDRKNADGTVSKISAIQELADAKTNVLALLGKAGVDVNALATKLAPLIKEASQQPAPLTIEQIEGALRTVLGELTLVPKAE